MKPESEVISDFNEVVNMTAKELDEFLKTSASNSTGLTKDGSTGSKENESIGHESGRKIVDILTRNPDKDADKYTDEDIEHMRRVVSYCKRHMAQEDHLKSEKSPEELMQSKSTRSLKNWGHDPMKTLDKGEQEQVKESGADKAPEQPEKVSAGIEGGSRRKLLTTGPKASKPASKKDGKPASKKAERASTEDVKPKSKSGKPASKKAEKKDENEDDAEAGDKRAADDKEDVDEADKPASKKTKTTKSPAEGSRKPPSRGAKK
ncbi:hypothetical protein P7C73_g5900, partial [Tremellales sp. Uapishka_1]